MNLIKPNTERPLSVGDKCLLLVPATSQGLANKLSLDPDIIADALRKDDRFLIPVRPTQPWSLTDRGMFEIDDFKTPPNIEDYFDRNFGFKPKTLADEISKRYKFRTTIDNETVFVYQDGVWIPRGESLIKREVSRLLGERAKANTRNETIAYIKSDTQISREEFDPNPYLLALENCAYDVITRKISERIPSDFLTVKLPIIFDKEAPCPIFEKFISEILDPSDVPVIQEMFGWCLIRNYEIQKTFMLLGDGSNGKTTLLNVLKAFLGTGNVSNISLLQLVGERAEFAKAEFYGKLANLFYDISAKPLADTGHMKGLTGGDLIGAEKKFKDSFKFVNYAKLIFSGNVMPRAYDDTDAYHRRWQYINFPNKFEGRKADPKLLEKMTSFQEISGIFNWAIVGLKRLQKKNAFSNSETTAKLREINKRLSNPVAAFCIDCIDENSEDKIPKEELYGEYIKYCKSSKLPIVSDSVFAKRLIQEVQTHSLKATIGGYRVYCWDGINLKKSKNIKQKMLK